VTSQSGGRHPASYPGDSSFVSRPDICYPEFIPQANAMEWFLELGYNCLVSRAVDVNVLFSSV
jgi:hypothetical protein